MSRISGLGPAAAAAGLDTAMPDGRFRRTVRFGLVTGALATGVEILPGTRLAVSFLGRTADARLNTAPEQAILTNGGGGVVVALPAARRIAGVKLDSFDPGDSVAAFRFDGPVVSEQAVATGGLTTNGALLGVSDRQLILRRMRDGAPLSLGPEDVTSVFVAYDSPNPRIGFALADDGLDAEFLSLPEPESGELVLPMDLLQGAAFAAALSARIQRFAEARQQPLPNPLAIDLVLEADQPCLARIDTFQLEYALTLGGFADSPEKQVLRFAGARPAVETLEVRLPPNAVVLAAPIAFSEAAGPPAKRDAVSATAAAASAATISDDGVPLEPGGLVGCRIAVAEARVAIGAEARLAAVESATVIAGLWEENEQGLPGRKLVESLAMDFKSGHPTSIRFAFPPEPLPAGPIWLVLRIERGRGVLALGTGDTGAVATQSGAGFAMADARGGAVGLLYAPLGGEAAAPSAGLALAVAGAALALERDVESGGYSADLAPVLNAMTRPRPERIAIQFASERKSLVTVDPPLIRYQEVP